MKIYPMLVAISKAGSKDAILGLLLGHLNSARDGGGTELAGKLATAVDLLSAAASIEDFLRKAKNL